MPWRRRRRGSDRPRPQGDGKRRPPLTLRHPRRTLAIALLAIVTVAAFGIDLEEKLSPATLEINGTPVARSNAMLRRHFGETALFAILLQGRSAALDRQGPELIRTLRRDPRVTTLSPWDRGSVAPLRPGPRRALVLVDFHVDNADAVKHKVPLLERTLEEEIHPPVRATQTGFATLSRSVQEESIDAAERGELIALPILLIVLLIVFRSPVAAAIPLSFGAVSVFTSRGLLAILTNWFGVDALALTVCTMMGLALGVDYSLLMVSRFREELAAGSDPLDAAWATRRTAGRTTVFAGSTLVLSMVVALFVVPGALLASLAGTLALVVVLTVLVATVAGPPILVLLGPNIDRWRIGPAPNGERSRLMTLVHAALRRPAPVAALIGFVVLLLAAPAIGLKTGPFSIGQLPRGDHARRDAELVEKAIGPGFEAPYVVVASAKRGPITEPARLSALSRFQRRVAALPGVQTVIGPGQISRRVAPLRETGNAAFDSNGKVGPLSQFSRLGRNLAVAAGGVAQLRKGLSEATSGAGLLAEGSGRAATGALTVSHGLAVAAAGSQRAVGALNRFASGTRRLTGATRQASLGALALKLNLPDIAANLRNDALRRSSKLTKSLEEEASSKVPQLGASAGVADEQLKAALQQLGEMTVGQSDPHYGPALEAVRKASEAAGGLPTELSELQKRLLADAGESKQVTAFLESEIEHIGRLAKVAKRLYAGLQKIEGGSKQLARGAARLSGAAGKLDSGLVRLGAGAAALASGVSQLTGGATALEENLAAGFRRSAPLQTGLARASVRVLAGNATLRHRIDRVRRATPGLFDSGYFVLSALDGSRGELRERAGEAIDLEHGGQAASTLVFSRYAFNSPGSIALDKRLETEAARLGREAGLVTGIAGGAATLNTYSHVTRQRIPYVIAAITLATFLVLVLVLRALPLAAIAVGLNLATVGVAFGILTLLFNVPEGWPLGGRTYVDAVGATMIFGVVFGLSIDYAVFLLVRMRERYDADDGHADAIEFGLEKTARVITGAAVIMMAVFIAFAGAPIATVSQLGIGLTVAVLLDATVVRIVLLPALMLLIGERVWWLPRPLERALPRLNV